MHSAPAGSTHPSTSPRGVPTAGARSSSRQCPSSCRCSASRLLTRSLALPRFCSRTKPPTSPGTPSLRTAASCSSCSALTLQLDLDEGDLGLAASDDVVLDDCFAEVRASRHQLGVIRPGSALEADRTAENRDDHVVQLMAVPAGRLARREAPFRHANALVVDLNDRARLRTRHARDFTLVPWATGQALVRPRRVPI